MKNAFLLMTAVLFVGMIIVGCGNDDNEDTHTPDYFPMAVGNSWTFQVFERDSFGHDTTYTQTQSLNHTATKDSFEWYVMDGDSITDSIYYRKDAYFLYAGYFFEISGIFNFVPILAAPLTPEVGFSQADTAQLGMFSIYSNVVVEAKETITVPRGTYECYRELLTIESSLLTLTMRSWFADTIGPIRLITLSSGDSTDMTLESYVKH